MVGKLRLLDVCGKIEEPIARLAYPPDENFSVNTLKLSIKIGRGQVSDSETHHEKTWALSFIVDSVGFAQRNPPYQKILLEFESVRPRIGLRNIR